MKGSTFSQGIVRYASQASTFVDSVTRKGSSRVHLSVALEWLALILVWSAVLAMGLAVAGALLGEQ